MRMTKQKIWRLLLVMAMLIGLVQTTYAEEAKQTEKETGKTVSLQEFAGYELLDQSIMKEDSDASSSQEANEYHDGDANWAFDGNDATAWHTSYGEDYRPATEEEPQSIEFGLGRKRTVGKIAITPKKDGTNGYIKDAKVYVKSGYEEWQLAKEFSFETKEEAQQTQYIDLGDVRADRIKLEITDSYNENDQKLVCIGEINVYCRKLKLKEFPGYELLDQTIMEEDSSASSFQIPNQYKDGNADWAFDENDATAWHTSYGADYRPPTEKEPHYIEFGLGEERIVGKLAITPKKSGTNGYIKDAKVYVKTGEGEWQEVKDSRALRTVY